MVANLVPLAPSVRGDVSRMIFLRMCDLATQITADPRDLLIVEEFAALAYQLRLTLVPPDDDVQSVLESRGLLLRRFVDPEQFDDLDLTDTEGDA